MINEFREIGTIEKKKEQEHKYFTHCVPTMLRK